MNKPDRSPYFRNFQLKHQAGLQGGRFSDYGNTLLEYSVTGVLVLLVIIGTITLVSGNFNTLLSELKDDMRHQVNAAGNAQLSATQQTAMAQQIDQIAGTVAEQDSVTNDLETDNNAVPQTSGGIGNTTDLANYIEQTIQQAVLSGDLASNQASLAMQLANKGHSIATMQGMLEKARYVANGNPELYQSMKLGFEGKSYSPIELGHHLTDTIQEFEVIRWDVENTGLPSSVVSVVQDVGPKIRDYGAAARGIAVDIDIAMAVGIGENVGDPQSVHYADDTHLKSKAVCKAGEHVDMNNQCQPN